MTTEPKIVDGLKVIELEPGAEVPPDGPPWAQRCDLVKTPNRSPSARQWMIGGGAVGAAVSLAALGLAHEYEALPGAALIVSLVVVLDGVWPGSRTVVTPSESGRFLAFADDLPAPRSDRAESVGCMASGIGVLTMLAAVSALVDGDLGTAAFLGLAGWWFYRLGRTGEMEVPDVPPASPEFLALADPHTPLPPSAAPASLPEASAAPPGSQPRGDS